MPERCSDSRYLPIAGYKPFINSAVKLALGDDNAAITEGRVAAIQSLSGTGACRIMAEFMHRFMPGGLLAVAPSIAHVAVK
jgi:aspartate aminotransferase, mitochondrial